MTTPNHIVESRLGCVPYVMGGTFALMGPLMFGLVGFVSMDDIPQPSERAVTGKISCASTVDVPFVPDVCSADVRVAAVKGTGRTKKYIELLDERVGPQTVELLTTGGPQSVDVPDRGRGRTTAWHGCQARHRKLSDISDLPVAQRVQAGHKTYSVTVWPFVKGLSLTVDFDRSGAATQLWCGSPGAFAEKIEEFNDDVRLMFGGLAGGSFLFGGLVMLGARSLRRREDASKPGPLAPPEEYVAWIAHRRAGEARVTYRERFWVARSLYRRHRSGSFMLEVPTTASNNMGFIRRSGTLGELGRAIDAAGGLEGSDGAPFGFPELDLIDPDRLLTWANDDRLRETINRVLAKPASADIVSLIFRGGVLRFTLREPSREAITIETVREWLDTLSDIVRAAESVA